MTMTRDLRLAIRGSRHRPVQTLTAIVLLALGLAATSTALTFVNTFFQEIPGASAGDRLVTISFVDERELRRQGVPYQDYLVYSEADEILEELAGIIVGLAGSLEVDRQADPHWVWGRAVTPNFFATLGVPMAHGPGFTPDADPARGPLEVVLSHRLWRELGGETSIVGTTVDLSRLGLRVVGVADPEFRTLFEGFHPDLWITISAMANLDPAYGRVLDLAERNAFGVLGRLPEGVEPSIAAERLALIANQLAGKQSGSSSADESESRPIRVEITPKLRIVDSYREEQTPLLFAMLLTAGLFLALTLANTSNILIARVLMRRRELAVHAAMGARTRDLVRRTLFESMLMTGCAAAIGSLLAIPLTRGLMWSQFVAGDALLSLAAAPVADLDLRFFVALCAVAILTGAAIAILPALSVPTRRLQTALKPIQQIDPRGFGGAGRRKFAASELMVATQVALSVPLLVAAGLMLRSFGEASGAQANFRTDGVLVATFSLASRDFTVEQRLAYLQKLETELEARAGVRDAVVSRRVPFGMGFTTRLEVEGLEEPRLVEGGAAFPGYFDLLDLSIVAGRALTEADSRSSPGVVVLNQAAAESLFPDQSPLGKRVSRGTVDGNESRSYEVVGVVSDVRFGEGSLDWWKEPTVYFSLAQHGHSPSGGGFSPGFAVLVSTYREFGLGAGWLEETLRAGDPSLNVIRTLSMPDLLAGQLYEQRANAHYFSALATLGLILAVSGLAALLHLTIASRRHEIGVRMALGADAAAVTSQFVARGLRPVILGLTLGIIASLVTVGFLRAFLYGVEVRDPVAFIAAPGTLFMVAVLVCYLTARRAAGLDPISALRQE